jgi:hypothetical protein
MNRPDTVNLYRGPDKSGFFDRDLVKIEKIIGLENGPKLDRLLAQTTESLPTKGTVNILDVGSGAGAFLRSLSDINQAYELLHQIKQKQLRLKAVGLTDAPNIEVFNTSDQRFKQTLTGKQRSNFFDADQMSQLASQIENYFYTLTATQTLEKFLAHRGVQQLNFVLASQSMLYLPAKVFQDTLITLMARLAPQGKILVSGVGWNTEAEFEQTKAKQKILQQLRQSRSFTFTTLQTRHLLPPDPSNGSPGQNYIDAFLLEKHL